MRESKTIGRALVLAALAAACTGSKPSETIGDEGSHPQAAGAARLEVTSPTLRPNEPIPAPNACTDNEHLGKSPPLAWSPGPAGTVAYAVTAVDLDARGFVHWAIVDLPPTTTSLPEGASPGGPLPPGAIELPNDFGKRGYGGPCPPPGALHRYVFRVTALRSRVEAARADAAFFGALDAAALATGSVLVTFRR